MADIAESGQETEAGQRSGRIPPFQCRNLLASTRPTPVAPSGDELGHGTDSKQAYGHFFSLGVARSLLQEWKAGMGGLAPSSINVRLSAVRKLVSEARRNGMLGVEEAASLTDVPNVREQGTRHGNWLTREQVKESLAVPDGRPQGCSVRCLLTSICGIVCRNLASA